MSLPTARNLMTNQMVVSGQARRWLASRPTAHTPAVTAIVLLSHPASWLPSSTPSITEAAASSGMNTAMRGSTCGGRRCFPS